METRNISQPLATAHCGICAALIRGQTVRSMCPTWGTDGRLTPLNPTCDPCFHEFYMNCRWGVFAQDVYENGRTVEYMRPIRPLVD